MIKSMKIEKLNISSGIILFLAFLLTSNSSVLTAQTKGPEGLYPVESSLAPPPNDLCVDAIPLNVGDLWNGTTTGATTTGDDPGVGICGTSLTTAGVWFLVEGTSFDITVNTCAGASYDTKIHVYEGTCGNLVCVDGNDDSCMLQSEVTFSSSCGATYYILVSGFGGSTGAFDLTLSGTVDPNACAPVPTMGEWGLIVLALALGIFGIVAVRQRKVQTA